MDKNRKVICIPQNHKTSTHADTKQNAAFGEPAFQADALSKQNKVGKRIAEARKSQNLSQKALSDALAEYGVSASAGAISKWENGIALPNPYQLLAICHELHITDPVEYFTGSQPEPADFSSELNKKGMNLLESIKKALVGCGEYAKTAKRRTTGIAEFIETRTMRISRNLASAGTGDELDADEFEEMEFPVSQIPEGADYGVRIHGDSMMPYYTDGQIVWIEKCCELNPGEVGLFMLDGKGYIKVYSEEMPDEDEIEDYIFDGVVRPKVSLVSYNKKYPPIRITEYCDLKIAGRVLN